MSTAIEWTDETWNPVTGCSRVSPGCEHCYAETLSLRHGWSTKPWTAQNAKDNVVLHPARLEQPLKWRKPRMVFVNSMSDLFHERISDEYIAAVFAVMALTPRHTFQVLTKRPERMLRWFEWVVHHHAKNMPPAYEKYLAQVEDTEAEPWPLPNVWLGVSVEDQRRADERIPVLLRTPAVVRWISAEPLLGHLAIADYLWARPEQPGLNWVVVGGESGPGFRQMHMADLRGIAAQCSGAGVPLYVKQDSGPRPGQQGRIPDELWGLKEFPQVSA